VPILLTAQITVNGQKSVFEQGTLLFAYAGDTASAFVTLSFKRIICGIPRRIRWAGHIARMGEGRGAYRVLVGRCEGRRPLGRPRRRWEDNIKMDLQEVGWGAWTELIWLRIGTDGGIL
jgi:hypothetical protein